MLSLVLAALVAADAGTPDAGMKKDGGVAAIGAAGAHTVIGTPVVRDAGTVIKVDVIKIGPVPVPIPTKWPDGGSFTSCKETPQICFSPGGDCDLLVVKALDGAAAPYGADVAIYSLNRESIVTTLLSLRQKNVPVRVLLDYSQMSDPKEQPQLLRMLDAGIQMRRDSHNGVMHDKFVVVNKRYLESGSLNYTNAAAEMNDENAMLWDCQKLAVVYDERFELMWSKGKDATPLILGKDGG